MIEFIEVFSSLSQHHAEEDGEEMRMINVCFDFIYFPCILRYFAQLALMAF